jgi:hypothetical protein
LNRSISGYCDCFNENRDIIVEYLPVTIGRSMSKHYKKGLFNACSDCPLSNAVRTGDICPIYRSALSSLQE